MLHPAMTIRPDDIIRSGIVQPFGVRATSPVAFARHEIDPFIRAIRPMGPEAGGVTMDGALGITTVANMPRVGFGAYSAQRMPLLGMVQANPMPLAGFGALSESTKQYLFAGGGLAVGLLIGFFLGRR
jgi:hypothetical protein